MRLLLDMGLPRRAAQDLRALGYQAEHVGDVGLSCAPDSEILARARVTGALVVTLDADFSRLLALTMERAPSVIHIRLPRVTREKLVTVLSELLARIQGQLESGAIVSVDESGARVRPLPIHA